MFFRSRKVVFRFAVASDGHYGEPKTEYESFHKNLVENITSFHSQIPWNFCVINGDIIHDQKTYLQGKGVLDKLPVSISYEGNHDK